MLYITPHDVLHHTNHTHKLAGYHTTQITRTPRGAAAKVGGQRRPGLGSAPGTNLTHTHTHTQTHTDTRTQTHT